MNTSSSLIELYERILSKRDPRVLHLPLLSSPVPLFSILVGYVLLVRQGPRLMLNTKAWDIPRLVVVYNAALVLFSGYTFYEISMVAYQESYSLTCEVVDTSSSPIALKAVNASWMFFFSKVIEIMDTVFLVVRKKPVSYLHSYHHASVLLLSWLGVSFVPGGQAWFAGCINSFVHVVMYAYYCMSAMGPNVRKYLWWKKYITRLQLTQFLLVFIHLIINTLHTDCPFPKLYNYTGIFYDITLVALFCNFYLKTYRQSKNPRTKQS